MIRMSTYIVWSLVLGITPPARAGELLVTTSAFGNVFSQGDPIVFNAATTAPRVAWRLIDLDGHSVAEGAETPRNGRALLYLPNATTGYYRLRVTTEGEETSGAATSEQALAVVSVSPGPADPRFNVVSHFAASWPQNILPLISRAGIAGLRDELPWAMIEPTRGTFAVPRALEDYPTTAHRLHIDVLVPLTYGNPLYDGGEPPSSPAGIAAYSRYVAEVVRHFGDRIGGVEVWNEYNGAFAAGAVLADRPRFYTDMLKSAFVGAKHANAKMTVVAGGVAGVPVPYLRKLFDKQALDNLDVVQIHPYYTVPEDAEYDVGRVQRLVAQRAPRRKIPIWATEAGSYDAKDRRRTAGLLVRLSTVLLAQGVGRIYWYSLKDTPDFPAAGLIENTGDPTTPYRPSPAYAAYSTLIRELRDAHFSGRDASDPRTRVYGFEGARGQVRIAWSTKGTTRVNLRATGPIQIVRIDGREQVVTAIGDVVQTDLTAEPIFIRGPVAGFTERRPDKLLADSVADFGGQQGAANWSYGSAPAAGFREARWSGNDWGDFWTDPEMPFLSIDRSAMQPSVAGGQRVAAVRRWRSPYKGPATIAVAVDRDADGGDGVSVEIHKDGAPIWRAELGTPGHGKALDATIPVTLRKGSIVDFEVLPASDRSDFDNTAIRVQIISADAAKTAPSKQED